MIELTRRRPTQRSLALTPLIDVVFQLLVFFLLTSTFIDPGVPLELPDAQTAQAQESKAIVIALAPDGGVHLSGKPVDLKQLGALLQQRVDGGSPKRVTLRGDVAARYGTFMQVVDACRSAGITDVQLASKAEQSAPTP